MSPHISRRQVLAGIVPAVAFLAAGCQAAAPPAPTAAPAKVATSLFLMTDMVWGATNLTEAQRSTLSCNLTSRFPRNSQMVWRTRVFDPATGDLMDDKTLKTVQIRLANGTNIDMKYGPHPPRSQLQESFWTGSWVIPKTAPTGILNYTILATGADGRTGEFKPFITPTSLPTITEEVLPDAPPTPVAKPAEAPVKKP